MSPSGSEPVVDVHIEPGERRRRLERDVRQGMLGGVRSLPPVWFYDHRGSLLFDQITRLEEYYPTRTERSILTASAPVIVETSEADTLVELGSGTSDKTLLLLDAMTATGRLRRFVPFDVSEEVLRAASAEIAARYGIGVHAVVGDFHRHLGEIPTEGRRLVAFLGGTIGNLRPAERRRFWADLDVTMDHRDHLLVGVDLVKDPARLVAAYDDSQGVTAEFNRNVLSVLNLELGADFEPEAFDHVAVWNADERWIEMRLRSTTDQKVRIEVLDIWVNFAAGDEILTEISAKFTVDGIREELWDGGFVLDECFTDPSDDFALVLAHPYC